MDPKPAHLAPGYGAQFEDEAIVAAYRHRPEYPAATFDVLERLLRGRPLRVLEVGSGTGQLTRPLAGFVDRIDAVEPSDSMRRAAAGLPRGRDPRIRWIAGDAETAPLEPPYGLVIAAESLHWTEWSIALPRLADSLAEGAVLALVDRVRRPRPWWDELHELIRRGSTNRDFAPYDLVDELSRRGLFTELGRETTAPEPFEQPVADHVESLHSRNGFSRQRMAPDAARRFDRDLTELVTPFAEGGLLRQAVAASIVWGVPHAPPVQGS